MWVSPRTCYCRACRCIDAGTSLCSTCYWKHIMHMRSITTFSLVSVYIPRSEPFAHRNARNKLRGALNFRNKCLLASIMPEAFPRRPRDVFPLSSRRSTMLILCEVWFGTNKNNFGQKRLSYAHEGTVCLMNSTFSMLFRAE